jgi:ubiquinone/menaquinone biosynthesis C-methylase UbiE
LAAASFDLILTDAFLTKLPHENQELVVDEWNRLLKQGGEVLTTIKLSDIESRTERRATPEQVERYVRKASDRYADRSGSLAITQAQLQDLARGYASNNVSYPLFRGDLADIFRDFDLDVVDEVTVEEYTLTSYAQVLAVKR